MMQDSRINHTMSMVVADRGDIDRQVTTLQDIMLELPSWDDNRDNIQRAISWLCQAKDAITRAEHALRDIAVPMEHQQHG